MLQKLNQLIYRSKYVYARNLNLAAPVDVSLELSSYCTNACGYCYHGSPKELPFKRNKMDTQLALKIIDQAAALGVHSLKFNGRGESTMHNDFEEITFYARERAKGRTFIDRLTNSNFNFKHNREDIFRGLCNQTKVKVSFDSFRKDIFEKQRKGSKYEETLANMSKFYNYAGRNNEMVVQAVRTKLNADEDLEGEIKRRFPSATASIRDVVGGRINRDLSAIETKKRDVDNRESCIQAHARLIIHADGKTSPCCPAFKEDLLIGDLNTQTLLEVWKSKQANDLRKSLKNKTAFDKDPCKNCSSHESYKGYRAPWNS
jgi:radical SAM protein with 4Fe4S-binding SPASM domain